MPNSSPTTNPSAPRRKRRIMPRQQRQLLERAIERLVELLDEFDGDADNEPSLGWLESSPYYPNPQDTSVGYGTGDDREDQCEDEGADDWARAL